MMVRRAERFFDERFGSNVAVRFFLTKIFPDHWSFYLGEFALYSLVLLFGTGIWLTFVYVASPDAAYASVVALSPATPVGYLVRQVHHWSATVFVATILVHMARIFFTAAFRKPREINWIVGLSLLALSSLAGFTGYSLPYDSLSGTGLRIADSVLLALPFVGSWAADVLNGGAYPGPLLLSHLYTFHVLLIPAAIVILLTAHLGMMVFQKHTQFVDDPTHVVGRRMWPDYALRAVSAFAVTVGLIMALAATLQINPIEAFGSYYDWTVPNPATPDWYAAFLDGALRMGPAVELTIFGHPIPSLFWPGVVMPTIVVAVLVAWPWIDARISGNNVASDVLVPASRAPWRTGVGVGFLFAAIVLTLAAGDDQQALTLHVPITSLLTFYRILLPVGSVAAGFLGAAFARELAARRDMQHGEPEPERAVALRRNVRGGFDEEAPQSI
ncbi:MAG: cytochrome bc complex cytochrome b subunit [Candidatus Eremiobacteraeota bacterium]|nr:cytochrome bc complex cytochrome b subunit [Candidatus Eremiobacteraeota bacterium]